MRTLSLAHSLPSPCPSCRQAAAPNGGQEVDFLSLEGGGVPLQELRKGGGKARGSTSAAASGNAAQLAAAELDREMGALTLGRPRGPARSCSNNSSEAGSGTSSEHYSSSNQSSSSECESSSTDSEYQSGDDSDSDIERRRRRRKRRITRRRRRHRYEPCHQLPPSRPAATFSHTYLRRCSLKTPFPPLSFHP